MQLSTKVLSLLGRVIGPVALMFLGPFVSGAARAEEKPKALIFCAEPAAMPRTGKETDGSPKGLDVAVARLICKQLGRSFEVHWCASPSCSRRCLRDKNCDVIL